MPRARLLRTELSKSSPRKGARITENGGSPSTARSRQNQPKLNLSKPKGIPGAKSVALPRAPLFVRLARSNGGARCRVDPEWVAEGPESTADGPSDKAPCLPNLSPPTGVRGCPEEVGAAHLRPRRDGQVHRASFSFPVIV